MIWSQTTSECSTCLSWSTFFVYFVRLPFIGWQIAELEISARLQKNFYETETKTQQWNELRDTKMLCRAVLGSIVYFNFYFDTLNVQTVKLEKQMFMFKA